MSDSNDIALAELERALIKRAENLAARYREQGERARDRLLQESMEHLGLREQREVLYAKNLADRTYRRRVQAHELRMRKRADILRWELVNTVIDTMRTQAAAFAERDRRYLPVLEQWIHNSVATLTTDTVIVQVNARDRARLADRFDTLASAFAPHKTVTLAEQTIDTAGGALIRDADDRMRINNTLEGRAERLADDLIARVLERLFASVPDMQTLFKG